MVEDDEDERRGATGQGQGDTAPAGTPAPVDVQAYIGRQLRAVFDDVAKQPIPDRFLALMQQLEAKGVGQ